MICHCKEFINIELLSPPPGCYPNGTCATDTGQCFVDLTIAESGHKRHKYSCVEHNPGDQINRVYATCSLDVPSATQIVLCCNDTDYCNGHLNPDEKLLTDPSMSPTPTPRLTDESRTNQGTVLLQAWGYKTTTVYIVLPGVGVGPKQQQGKGCVSNKARAFLAVLVDEVKARPCGQKSKVQ